MESYRSEGHDQPGEPGEWAWIEGGWSEDGRTSKALVALRHPKAYRRLRTAPYQYKKSEREREGRGAKLRSREREKRPRVLRGKEGHQQCMSVQQREKKSETLKDLRNPLTAKIHVEAPH